MKKILFSSTLILASLLSFNSQAFEKISDKEKPKQAIIGASTYLGLLQNNDGDRGQMIGASLYFFVFNWSLEAKNMAHTKIITPYIGVGVGRLLQLQRSANWLDKTSFRLVSEIAIDEWVDKRNHWTVQFSAEKLDVLNEAETRLGVALGYTF